MVNDHTLTLLIRLLEECLEQNYTAEELRSKIADMLRLLNGGIRHCSCEMIAAKDVSK